jgi:hypothetical protein
MKLCRSVKVVEKAKMTNHTASHTSMDRTDSGSTASLAEPVDTTVLVVAATGRAAACDGLPLAAPLPALPGVAMVNGAARGNGRACASWAAVGERCGDDAITRGLPRSATRAADAKQRRKSAVAGGRATEGRRTAMVQYRTQISPARRRHPSIDAQRHVHASRGPPSTHTAAQGREENQTNRRAGRSAVEHMNGRSVVHSNSTTTSRKQHRTGLPRGIATRSPISDPTVRRGVEIGLRVSTHLLARVQRVSRSNARCSAIRAPPSVRRSENVQGLPHGERGISRSAVHREMVDFAAALHIAALAMLPTRR